jgi:hypothetical protein
MLDMVNRAGMTLSPLLRLGRSCGSDQKCIGAAYPLQTSQAGEEQTLLRALIFFNIVDVWSEAALRRAMRDDVDREAQRFCMAWQTR